MQKIPTLFIRSERDPFRVTETVHPDAAWVLAGEGVPTIKRDGTNVRVTVQAGKLVWIEKRRNPGREEKALGVEPYYIGAMRDDKSNKHIFAAVDAEDFSTWPEGQHPCEALGPMIQGGVESDQPGLYPFLLRPLPFPGDPRAFSEIREALASVVCEGIVWHHPDGRMAKVKRTDFGLHWPVRRKP